MFAPFPGPIFFAVCDLVLQGAFDVFEIPSRTLKGKIFGRNLNRMRCHRNRGTDFSGKIRLKKIQAVLHGIIGVCRRCREPKDDQ
jgi:hypothetical protein